MPLFREVLFIFSHYVVGILRLVVQISRLPYYFGAECIELLKAEIEKSYVVCFETEDAVVL